MVVSHWLDSVRRVVLRSRVGDLLRRTDPVRRRSSGRSLDCSKTTSQHVERLEERALLTPTVTLTASDPDASEAGPDSGTFSVMRMDELTGDLVVNYSLGGAATNGGDFQQISGYVTILDGNKSASIVIIPIQDANTAEGSETVTLSLAEGKGYNIDKMSNGGTVTITDGAGSVPTVTITADDADASESGSNSGAFTISLSSYPTTTMTVNLSISGSATNKVDYAEVMETVSFSPTSKSATITISPVQDANNSEGPETVVLSIADPTNKGEYTYESKNNSATVMIADEVVAQVRPEVGNLHLVSDTEIPADLITTDLRVAGSVTHADGPVAYLPLQYDLNGDGFADGSGSTDPLGNFMVNLANFNVSAGAVNLSVRAGEYGSMPMNTAYGSWSTFSFAYTVPLPAVSGLALANDTGTPDDMVTADARVTGNLVLSNLSVAHLPLQFDLNGDGIADGSAQTDINGHFAIDLNNSNLTAGIQTISIRGGRNVNGPMSVQYGDWSEFTFTYAPVPQPRPEVEDLHLVSDTEIANDLVTSDLQVSGSVTHVDGSIASLPVQYDLNGDGIAEGTAYTNQVGEFTIDLANSHPSPGSVVLRVRAGESVGVPISTQYGSWATFTFTYAVALPIVSDLSLVADTGTPEDLITTDARVSGLLTVAEMSAAYLPVQYDLDEDGVIDGATQTDVMGQFTIDLRDSNLAGGDYTISVRGGRSLNGSVNPTYGAWSDFTFTYIAPVFALPVVGSLGLVNDTGTPGDLITTDPRISGSLSVTDASAALLPVQYDSDGDGIFEGVTQTGISGQFTITLTGPSLAAGSKTVAVRGGRYVNGQSEPQFCAAADFSFTYVLPTTPPPEDPPNPPVDPAVVEIEAAIQAIQATYVAAQQQAESEYTAAIAAAEAAYTDAMELSDAAYDDRIEEIVGALDIELEESEDEQGATKAAAEAAYFADRAAVLNEYNQAKLDAEAAYDARQAAADLVYAADLQAANDAYDLAGEAIEDTLDAEEAAAAAVRAGDLAAAHLALNNALAGAGAARDSAKAVNQAARTASLVDGQDQLTLDTAQFPSSWTYDVSLVQNDPAVVAAMNSANDSFELALGTADQAYETAVDSAEDDYQSAITAAGGDWESAWATAELARLNARAAAATVYQTAVTTATSIYQTRVASATTIRNAAKQAAADVYDTSEAGVRATRNGTLDDAWDDYTQAMTAAQSLLDSGLAADQILYNGRMVTIRTAWNTAVTGAAGVFNTSMNKAADDYQTDKASHVDSIYDNPIGLAWSTLQTLINGISSAISSVAYGTQYAVQQAAIEAAQLAFSLGLGTQEDVWQAKKDLAVWEAAEQLAYITSQKPLQIAYVQQERAAAKTLAIATAADAFVLASQQLSATETLGKAKIDANSTYEQGIAGVERDQLVARVTKTAAYAISALNAALTLDQARVAAEWTYAIAVAGFQETYDKAVNVAEQTYALAEQAAAVVRSKAMVDAEVSQVKANAVADLAAVKASTAANTAFTRAAAAAAVAYVETAATAATIYSIAYTAAVKSAVTPVIFAQAAAICQQLGGGPDAFLFTQYCSMEKLFEVDAWASQVQDDVAAEAACSRAESLAYQADANAQAAADEMHTNAEASAAKKALEADADAWKIAEKENIDAAAIRGTEDINAAKEANDLDAEADKDRSEQEANASAYWQEVDLISGHRNNTRKVTANKAATISGANAGYEQLVADAPANVILLKARVEADIDKARAEAARNSGVVVAGAAEDEKAANQKAEEVMSNNITKATDYLAQLSSQPLSSFESGPAVRPFSVEWAMGPGLDGAVNFATGFMDGFTGRGWSAVVSQTGLLSYVDRDSMAYMGGQITGAVYGVVLGAATGMTCQVSWATQVSNVMLAFGTGYGMYDAAPRILNGTASVWDYVAFLPAGGYILGSLNRACFVAETQIATGWGSVTDASLTVALPGADSGPQAVWSQSWSVEWILLGTGIVMLTAIYRNKRENQETADLDRFFEELTPDDLSRGRHATLPPPDPNLTGEQPDSLESDDTAWIQHELLSGTALAAGSADDRPNQTPVAAIIPFMSTEGAGRPSSRRRAAAPAWQMSPWMTTVALLLALGCFWLAIPSNSRTGATPAFASTAAENTPSTSSNLGVEPQRALQARRIDQIRPGMRVLADNPELHGQHVPERAIDPQTTRLITLHQVKPDGQELTVQTLMSVDTLAAEATAIWSDANRPPEHRPWVGNAVDVILRETLLGQSLDLNIPEMGAEGPAQVIAIDSCPQIESANEPGRRLVTSVFRHTSNDIIDLEIQGQNTPIGTTSNHPFWSVDREAFIPAGELRIGERLKQADGLHAHVARVTPRPRVATTVYNLEVDGQHVYHVGWDGLLVHNTCIRPLPLFGRSHGGTAHNGVIDREIREVLANGGYHIRKNQAFVDDLGNKLSSFRPDLQWTQGGVRHILQVVGSNPETRILELMAADPTAVFHIIF